MRCEPPGTVLGSPSTTWILAPARARSTSPPTPHGRPLSGYAWTTGRRGPSSPRSESWRTRTPTPSPSSVHPPRVPTARATCTSTWRKARPWPNSEYGGPEPGSPTGHGRPRRRKRQLSTVQRINHRGGAAARGGAQPQGGQLDTAATRVGGEGILGGGRPCPFQEPRPHRHEVAAQDDQPWVGDVDEHGQPMAQPRAGTLHRADGRGVPRFGAFHGGCDQIGDVLARQRPVRELVRDGPVKDRVDTRERLHAALPATPTLWPVRIQRHVPELPRKPARAAQPWPIGQHPRSDTALARDVDQVRGARVRNHPVLGDRAEIGV